MTRKTMLFPNKPYNTATYNHFADTLTIFTLLKKSCIDLSETNPLDFSLTS